MQFEHLIPKLAAGDSREFEELMELLPMPCRVYRLNDDGEVIFCKANRVADTVLKMQHSQVEGLPIVDAFPNLTGTIVPDRYLSIFTTGTSWGYHGLLYRENGSLLGLFHIHAFRLAEGKIATFLIPQTDEDPDVVCHDKSLKFRENPVGVTGQTAVEMTIPHIGSPGVLPDEARDQADSYEDYADIQFTDIFTIEELEAVQKAFTDVTGVASIITLPDGRPVTRQENFCKLCSSIIRPTKKGLANCIHSDARIGKPNRSGPTIRPCHSVGLWDGGASIIIGDKHIANWLIGQVRLSDRVDQKKLREYAREIGADEAQFVEAYSEVPVMGYQQFYRICRSLYLFANLLSDIAYQNMRLARANAAQQEISQALGRSKVRLHHLSSQLILTQEEERKRLATELHDGIGQSLTAAKYSIDNILLNINKPREELRQTVKSAAGIIKSIISDVRRMQVDLRPRMLDELGITSTLSWFCREFRTVYGHIDIRVRIAVNEDDIPLLLKPAIFRITQEAMNNAAKHSGADRVEVLLKKNAADLVLGIADNGSGFDSASALQSDNPHRGLGLDSMKERAELCGGNFEIRSTRGTGTSVVAVWPGAVNGPGTM